MARRRVKLAFIENEGARRSTLKKRRSGLIKKVQQLSVLCDVDACLLIYAPGEEVTTWPEPVDARRVALRFRGVPHCGRERKMVDHVAFLQQRLALLRDTLRRRRRENREMELRSMMFDGMWDQGKIDQLSPVDAAALAVMVDGKLQELCKRREEAMRMVAAAQPPQSLQTSPADSEDPLGMMLRQTTERRSDDNITMRSNDDIMVVPAPPPPSPPPPSMDENPLAMVLRQETVSETFLYLRNSQFGEWIHNMFSDYRRL
ncbi:agamous-like MADS-box protein AGL80 [Curcuma longa]|uniref:agamous-like MADS-box protein AGL80 n=1 Tax=Curcuma longa TaxID=136217 RepID=UPI003D9DD606